MKIRGFGLGTTVFSTRDLSAGDDTWFCTRSPNAISTLHALHTVEEELVRVALRFINLPKP